MKSMTAFFVLLGGLTLAAPMTAQADPGPYRRVEHQVTIAAPVTLVWRDWTTSEGLASFFTTRAMDSRIELKPMGYYELYFLLDAPEGQRGGEGNRIIGFETERMLSFTWNNRPDMPVVRPHHTHVVMYFEALNPDETRVTLIHDGWGTTPEWDEAFAYFSTAWPSVLARQHAKYAKGSIGVHPGSTPRRD
jgi:uncharacterized protein YndB with AHSA1/START domain